MRILHITATHLNKSGGIPVVLKFLVEYQNKIENVEARVLSVNADVKSMDSQYFYFKSEIGEIAEFIDEFIPDIIVMHSLYFMKYRNISKIIREKRYRYFIQPHSSFGNAAQKKSKTKKILANTFLFSEFIKGAYGYIFLNESEMKDSKFRTSNDLIIPNGIEIKNIKTIKNNSPVKLYFLGRLDISHKGLDILVHALKQLDDMKQKFVIDFYGTGTDREIEYIMDNISKYNNIKATYKGPIYGDAKDSELSKYDMMILTSRYEGFPVTVLEAMSYGCPCIVSDGTNVKEIIDNNKLGWGCSLDNVPEIILKALDEYSNNSEFYQRHVKEFVEKEFCWENIAATSVEQMIDSK